jgi:RNA polymerase sigma-70 factor (ECF subfamily)
MVSLRMDPRIAVRCDPSDVVQEALLDAHRLLPQYLKDRPLPFYPWLRQLAWQQLVAHHRRHLKYKVRSVLREDDVWRSLSDHSTGQLAERLVESVATPSQAMARAEAHRDMMVALRQLRDDERDVLVLRILEELSSQETAAVLGISAEAVRVRQFRALQHVRQILDEKQR